MRNIFVYGLVVLMVCSCRRTTDNAANIIMIDRFASNLKEVSINEIASHIEYIQLETSPKSLLGRIDKIQIKDNKIYVLDFDNALLLVFDRSGKFIRQIGTQGRGPGEYIGILDFALRDSVVLLLDGMQSKMILYDSLGRLMAEKQLPVQSMIMKVAFHKGMPAGERNYPDFAFNNGFRVSIYDRSLDLIADILKSNLLDEASARQIPMRHSRSFFSNVNDTLTFWECRDNVVYKIVDENKIEKKYLFQYNNPAKFEDGMNNLKPGSYEISGLEEARNHLFLVGGAGNEYHRLIYFKETGKGVSVDGKLKNNTGLDFFPDGLAEDGKAFYSFSVYAYKAELEKSNLPPENLDPKLKSLLQTCRFDDNLCIMLVTLK